MVEDEKFDQSLSVVGDARARTKTPGAFPLTPYTLNPARFTLHSTPCTLHPTPYTLHLTPYTLHPQQLER